MERFRLAFGNEPMDHRAAYLRETRSLAVSLLGTDTSVRRYAVDGVQILDEAA